MKDWFKKNKAIVFAAILLGIPVGGVLGLCIVNPDAGIMSIIIAVGITSLFTNLAWLKWNKTRSK